MSASPAQPAGRAQERLWNRDFVLLWQGQLVSQAGTQAAFIATMLWTLESTGSAGLMAGLMITSSLPGVLLGPLAGVIVDRHAHRVLLIAGDVSRGVAALVVTWGVMRWSGEPDVVMALLFLSAAVNGLAGAVFNPTVKAV